jgi:hypothetical protein
MSCSHTREEEEKRSLLVNNMKTYLENSMKPTKRSLELISLAGWEIHYFYILAKSNQSLK